MITNAIARTAYLLPKNGMDKPVTTRTLAVAIADRAELTDLAGWLPGVDTRPRKGATKVKITITVEEIQ